MEQFFLKLIDWYLYDIHIFSQGWLYYWLLIPFVFYFSFFIMKWMIITLPIWLPFSIIANIVKKDIQMPLIQTPVKSIRIDYKCDNCNKGFYRTLDNVFNTNSPHYIHECTECGHQKSFNERYPTIRYIAEGELLNLDEYI